MNTPLYKQIFDSILKKIEDGELQRGDQLPSEKELADQFNVSRITSKKALDLLADEKIIERIQGKGSFLIFDGDTSSESFIKKQPEQGKDKLKIGFVLSDFADTFGAKLIKSIEKVVSENDADLIIKITDEQLDKEEKAITELVRQGVDGMIIMPIHGEHYNIKILELVLKKFPIILVDRFLHGILASSVSSDNIKASEQATEYLSSLGHRQIAYITSPMIGTSVLEDRLKGFEMFFRKNAMQLPSNYILETPISEYIEYQASKNEIESEMERVKKFIQDNSDVTAFVICRYALAEIIEHVLYTLGKRIPEDYSIICFDSPKRMIGKPRFTHVLQPEEKIGETAAKQLLAKINGEHKVVRKLLDTKIIEGRSAIPIKD